MQKPPSSNASHARQQLWADYGQIAVQRGVAALEATTVRLRSPEGLDLLAFLATRERLMTCAELVDDLVSSEVRWTPAAFDAQWLAGFARVLSLLGDGDDHLAVREALRGAWQLDAESLKRRHALTFANALLAQGNLEELEQVIPTLGIEELDRLAIEADIAAEYANRSGHPQAIKAWNDSLAKVMGASEPVFRDVQPGSLAFDDLVAVPVRRLVDGPLVSVLMPVFRPDQALLTSVRSILDQSWENLELLIVDDASGPDFDEVFGQAEALDRRIRIVRKRTNEGTYRARNTGLKFARGALITGQDADDWSHPRRIELQARLLIDDPSKVASISHCMRTLPDLSLAYRGYPSVRLNASSLMYRSHPVHSRIGYFDSVRKAADTEYHKRIEAVFGRRAIVELSDVLAVVRLQTGSLSRSDFAPGWHHERRVYYRSFYRRWHRRIIAGEERPFLDDDQRQRPFPAPRSMLGGASTKRRTYDVVLLGDWSKYGGPQKSMMEEARALRAAGLSVGIANKEAMRFMRGELEPPCAAVLDAVERGEVEWILWDDPVDVGLVILRYPPILQFCDPLPTSWRLHRLWLVANQAPVELDGSDLRYLPPECDERARKIFGIQPSWVPQGPLVRRSLLPWKDFVSLSEFDSPGIIEPDEWRSYRSELSGRRPVVGRYSRDELIKFPGTSAELETIYADPDVDVLMMGAAKSVPKIMDGKPLPLTWRLLPHGAEPVARFLSQIDFFVYFHDQRMVEAFGRSILEAAASGCVVIVPRSFQETFGGAALYADPAEVMPLVKTLASDPFAYKKQQSLARTTVAKRFSHRAFVENIAVNSPLSDAKIMVAGDGAGTS